jgi:hypothetical protein
MVGLVLSTFAPVKKVPVEVEFFIAVESASVLVLGGEESVLLEVVGGFDTKDDGVEALGGAGDVIPTNPPKET